MKELPTILKTKIKLHVFTSKNTQSNSYTNQKLDIIKIIEAQAFKLLYFLCYTLSPQEYTPSKYATSKKSNIHVVPTTDLLNTILPN